MDAQHGGTRHPAARTWPLDRRSHGEDDGCSGAELPGYAAKSGPSSVFGSLCVCKVCVSVSSRPFVEDLLTWKDWTTSRIDFFFFFLKLQSTLVSRSESPSCFFLFLFCLFFLIYFWQHYWHIILLPCRPCKYFKHWIILGFHDALKHFELAQSPTIHLFLMYYCQTYCSCLTTFVEGFFTLKA